MANVICELPKELLFLSGQDTKIRFSLEPYAGDPSFNQWKDAMKMVARLPEGVPIEFRKKVSVYFSPLYLNTKYGGNLYETYASYKTSL